MYFLTDYQDSITWESSSYDTAKSPSSPQHTHTPLPAANQYINRLWVSGTRVLFKMILHSLHQAQSKMVVKTIIFSFQYITAYVWVEGVVTFVRQCPLPFCSDFLWRVGLDYPDALLPSCLRQYAVGIIRLYCPPWHRTGGVGWYCTCADEPVMFVALPVVTAAELSRNIPFFGRANALPTVTRTWNHKGHYSLSPLN